MWHFGIDACTEYTGDKFSATWEVGQHELIRVYTKDFRNGMNNDRTRSKSKTRVRVELQEYPQSTVEDAIRSKIQTNHVPSHENDCYKGAL
jgi:hypothetical protein